MNNLSMNGLTKNQLTLSFASYFSWIQPLSHILLVREVTVTGLSLEHQLVPVEGQVADSLEHGI